MVVFEWWSVNVVEVITGLVDEGEGEGVSKVGIIMLLLVMNLIDIRVSVCTETPANNDGNEDNSSDNVLDWFDEDGVSSDDITDMIVSIEW